MKHSSPLVVLLIVAALDLSASGPFDDAGLVSGGYIGADGKTLYVSFRQRFTHIPVVSPDTESDYLRYMAFEFNAGPDMATDRALIIGHDDRSLPQPNNAYGVASVVNNGRADDEPGQYQPLGTPDTAVNLMVVKLEFGSGNNDSVSVFRNPESLGSETGSAVDATLTGNFQFDRIAVARFVGNDPQHEIDEILFGTTWASVVPEPSSLGLCLVGLIWLGLLGRRRKR
jgi:hypothetical protein